MVGRIARWTGVALLLVLLTLLVLAAMPLPRAEPRFSTPSLIGPVTVVDVEAQTTRGGQAIAIENGRIARIVPIAALSTAEKAGMRDGGNAFAVPGLWDMHALFTRYAAALEHPLSLAHGITRTRNILDCPGGRSVSLHPCEPRKARWNAAVRDGRMLGPLIIGSGTYPVADATPGEAQALVRGFPAARRRFGHIKIYDGLPRASFFALMEEARRQGVEVSGHIPTAVAVSEAGEAGVKAIAHARALPIGCSAREAEIMRLRTAKAPAAQWMKLALESFDPAKCSALWETLRRRGTFVSPTLITRFNETREGLDRLSGSPQARAATPGLIKFIWQEDEAPIRARGAEEEAVYRAFYHAAAERTAEASAAGVRLLAGTDSGDLWVTAGLGLHQEMALWEQAGIPKAAILRAATAHPADYFGLGRRLGRLAPGHSADLLLLRADPFHDLSALRRPEAVMLEGRLYDRAALDAGVEAAEDAAASWRYPAHFLRDLLRNPLGFAG
jgi:hypothetical protein